MNYSEQDVEQDCYLYLKDGISLSQNSCLSFLEDCDQQILPYLKEFDIKEKFLRLSETSLKSFNVYNNGSIDFKDFVIRKLSSVSQTDLKQLKKDIIRDKFLVNSKRITGASFDLEEFLLSIGILLDDLFDIYHLPRITSNDKYNILTNFLTKANRTDSGGLVFNYLNESFDSAKYHILPQSSSVLPIKIEFNVENISDIKSELNILNFSDLALKVHISSEFEYNLASREDQDEVNLQKFRNLIASYEFQMYFPLTDLSDNSNRFEYIIEDNNLSKAIKIYFN